MKRLRVFLILFALTISITGCQNTTGQAADSEKAADTEMEDSKNEDDNQNNVKIEVFYSNDEATAFESEEEMIEILSPEAVIKALVDKGVLTADVKINDFEVTEVDGKQSIEIDFNSSFASYINNMGSTGEYYIIGSLTNTFLGAYDCEQMKITVDGKVLETGHAEYPGYLRKFE